MEIEILRRQGKGILEIMAQLSIFFQKRLRGDLRSNIAGASTQFTGHSHNWMNSENQS